MLELLRDLLEKSGLLVRLSHFATDDRRCLIVHPNFPRRAFGFDQLKKGDVCSWLLFSWFTGNCENLEAPTIPAEDMGLTTPTTHDSPAVPRPKPTTKDPPKKYTFDSGASIIPRRPPATTTETDTRSQKPRQQDKEHEKEKDRRDDKRFKNSRDKARERSRDRDKEKEKEDRDRKARDKRHGEKRRDDKRRDERRRAEKEKEKRREEEENRNLPMSSSNSFSSTSSTGTASSSSGDQPELKKVKFAADTPFSSLPTTTTTTATAAWTVPQQPITATPFFSATSTTSTPFFSATSTTSTPFSATFATATTSATPNYQVPPPPPRLNSAEVFYEQQRRLLQQGQEEQKTDATMRSQLAAERQARRDLFFKELVIQHPEVKARDEEAHRLSLQRETRELTLNGHSALVEEIADIYKQMVGTAANPESTHPNVGAVVYSLMLRVAKLNTELGIMESELKYLDQDTASTRAWTPGFIDPTELHTNLFDHDRTN
jgi:hypothetical protein